MSLIMANLRIGVIGIELKETPELVSAGATAGLKFLDEIETIKTESEKLRKQGVKVQIVLDPSGDRQRFKCGGWQRAGPVGWPDHDDCKWHSGHDRGCCPGRPHPSRLEPDGRPHPGGRGYECGRQLFSGADGRPWPGCRMGRGATRIAKNLGVAKRPDVQAIVDDANAQTAVLRNQVIGTQQFDIKRAPTRLFESAMGNMVADAMRLKYPGVDAAYTNSGGLRQDLLVTPPTAGEQPGEITWGEMFSVLPFGNRTVIETLTGAQLEAAFINGFTPFCDPAFAGGTGRFPQISGLEGDLPLQWYDPGCDRHVEDAAGHKWTGNPHWPGGHCPLRHQRLHVRRWRWLHHLCARHECSAAGR